LKFLIDAQLPPALAQWISGQGRHATHVCDIGLHAVDDRDVWEHARREGAVIISKDQDFVDRWLLSESPVTLIWIRKGNCSNDALMAWLEPLWAETVKRLEEGEQFIELRA
jgi:predicted nuclease of predicted toxin-antitoxin system